MVSIYDVDAAKLIGAVAEKLKKAFEMPTWARFVKTGVHKQRPPVQADWWYIRAAAVLRTIYKNGPVGISKLRSKYGGGKDRGREPRIFIKGSGKVLRTIVQQLETAGFLKKADKGKGRLITAQGQSLLEKTATEAFSKYVKVEAPKEVKKVKVEEIKVEAPKAEEKPKKAKEPKAEVPKVEETKVPKEAKKKDAPAKKKAKE